MFLAGAVRQSARGQEETLGLQFNRSTLAAMSGISLTLYEALSHLRTQAASSGFESFSSLSALSALLQRQD